MGKSNFNEIYGKIKSEHSGQISCKISYFSDKFDETKNYAGIIIYGINGKTQWYNQLGQVRGYRGRSFYIIIKCTDNFPSKRDLGHGRVHHYPIEEVLGYAIDKDVLCGGFSWHNNQLKFSSIWLNANHQTGLPGVSGSTDGDKNLSEPEKKLVEFCFGQYRQRGVNSTFVIPDDLDRVLSNFSKTNSLQKYDHF